MVGRYGSGGRGIGTNPFAPAEPQTASKSRINWSDEFGEPLRNCRPADAAGE